MSLAAPVYGAVKSAVACVKQAGLYVGWCGPPTSGEEKVARLKAMGVDTVIATATTTVSMQPGDSIPVTDQHGQLDLVKAATKTGVKRFVMVSIPLATEPCALNTAKRTVENAIISSVMEYTILRPCIFMEAWLSPALGFDYPNAKATIYGEDHAKNRYISLGDVAQYVVESLTNHAAVNAFFDLGQPQDYSMREVVRAFEQVTGKTFELTFVPTAAFEDQAAAATDPLQESFTAMMHNMATGIQTDPCEAEKVFSLSLVSLDDYVRRVSA